MIRVKHVLLAFSILAIRPGVHAQAQQPDSSTQPHIRFVPRTQAITPAWMLSAIIEVPTLVVVAPEHAPDTLNIRTAGCAAAKVAKLACASVVPRASIVDRQHAAISHLPEDVDLGYVIAAPGMRPELIRGAVAPAALADSITVFMRVYDRQFRNR